MNHLVLLFASVVTLACTTSEANAQRLFGRIFRVRPVITQPYRPVVQPNYSYTPSTTRVPVPISGYGSNLHRNYMIRRAQKQTAITGIPPRDTANIRWAR